MTRYRFTLVALFTVLSMVVGGCDKSDQASNSADPGAPPSAPAPSQPQQKAYAELPKMQIDTKKTYIATIDTTAGKIVLELFTSEAPNTVNNFIVLSRDGFYNKSIFHRVIPGFMIQGGDPTGTGRGGPGYAFDNENGSTTRRYVTGAVGMANSGPNTNGSQFFIMDGDNALPPESYTLFGQVLDGQDVVHKIVSAPRDESDRPYGPTAINSITITEKGTADSRPELIDKS